MSAKVSINQKDRTVTIVAPLNDALVMSATGNTESLVAIRNEHTGLAHTDGRPLKLTLQLYVKTSR